MQVAVMDAPSTNDQLLTIRDVAQRLRVSEPTVKRLIYGGVLRSVKLADRRLIRESDLAAYIASLDG